MKARLYFDEEENKLDSRGVERVVVEEGFITLLDKNYIPFAVYALSEFNKNSGISLVISGDE